MLKYQLAGWKNDFHSYSQHTTLNYEGVSEEFCPYLNHAVPL